MNYRWLLTILYGLLVIGTGLMRSVDAGTFKPNAFGFCMVMGLTAIAAGYLLRVGKWKVGVGVAFLATASVLAFYLNCFITQDSDATLRVASAILASIAELCVITLPGAGCCASAHAGSHAEKG
ncbi:MAG: hypothetical protein N2C14_16010 [Planctomycetales bacterium]